MRSDYRHIIIWTTIKKWKMKKIIFFWCRLLKIDKGSDHVGDFSALLATMIFTLFVVHVSLIRKVQTAIVIYNYIYNCSDSATINIYACFHNATFYVFINTAFYKLIQRNTFILTIPQFFMLSRNCQGQTVWSLVLYHSFPLFKFIILHGYYLGVYMLPRTAINGRFFLQLLMRKNIA